jgi:pimeloyl-ACP methyl ester carboxylesterase
MLLGAIVLASGACSTNREAPAVKNGDVQISYTSSGDGKVALVFVHGWAINKEYWNSQVDYFNKKYRVVTIDLAAHGKSGSNRSTWTADEYANDVIAVISALKLDKVVLIGHSMSGDINLIVAKMIPERIAGFIGIDNFKDITTAFNDDDRKNIDEFMAMMAKNYDSLAEVYTRQGLFPPNYSDTASVNRVMSDVRKLDHDISMKTLESIMQVSLQECNLLSSLNVPVELVQSDYTPTNRRAVGKCCKKGLKVYTVRGVGHYPMIEKADEFNKALETALTGAGM